MKRQVTKHHRRKQQTVAKGRSTPSESEARIEARQQVEKNYPVHSFNLVAEVAARIALGRGEITSDKALNIGRAAILLLDGTVAALAERTEQRDKFLKSAAEVEEFPDRLSWSAGKRFIMRTRTDNLKSSDQFKSMLKDLLLRVLKGQEESDAGGKLRRDGKRMEPSIEKNLTIFQQQWQVRAFKHSSDGLSETSAKKIPQTIQRQYQEVEMRYRQKGFNSWELRSLRDFADGWRRKKDQRRKKTS
jgi:hypothetical protein